MNINSRLFEEKEIVKPKQHSTSEKSIKCLPSWSVVNQTNLDTDTVAHDSENTAKKASRLHGLGQQTENIHFRSADYKIFSNIFVGSIMVQYILTFFAIPFSEVDNRPGASVLSYLLGYLSFVLCILMIPAGIINVPTKLSLQSSLISCVLKFVDLAANIYSLILCLGVKEPMIEYTYDQERHPVLPLDITVYVQVISSLLLIMSFISLFFAIVVFLFNFKYCRVQSRKEMAMKSSFSMAVVV